MTVLDPEVEWNIQCGGHFPGYPRTLPRPLPAHLRFQRQLRWTVPRTLRLPCHRLRPTASTLHVSFPISNATAVCLTCTRVPPGNAGRQSLCGHTSPSRQEPVGQCSTAILGKVIGGEGSAHFTEAPRSQPLPQERPLMLCLPHSPCPCPPASWGGIPTTPPALKSLSETVPQDALASTPLPYLQGRRVTGLDLCFFL